MKSLRLWASGWVFWLTWGLAEKRTAGFLSVAVETEDSESLLGRLAAATELLREDPNAKTETPTLRVLIGDKVSEHFFPEKALLVLPIEPVRDLDTHRLAKVIEEYAAEIQAGS